MAHGILGAAVSFATGNDPTTGTLSAITSEAGAKYVSSFLFGQDDPSKLTEEQKVTVSSITTLAGLGIGSTTGDINNAINASEVSRSAVDNNDTMRWDGTDAEMRAVRTRAKSLYPNRVDKQNDFILGRDQGTNEAVIDFGKNIWGTVQHPLRTAKDSITGLYDLVSSPYQSAKTIYISVFELKALYEETKKSDPKLAGRIEGYYGTKLGMFIGGSVATAPIGGVMAKAIKQSSAARKVAQETAALNRIGNNQAQPKTVAANQAINNKLSDSYLNQQATKQVGQVTVPIRFNEHIINGEVKKGKLTGGHSIHGNLTIVSRGQPNRYGVYEAEISIPKPNDPSKILTKKSTMFPDSWTPDRIKVEVNAAYNNRISVPNRPGMWQGTTPSGIAVAGYTHPDLTVYPLRGGLIR